MVWVDEERKGLLGEVRALADPEHRAGMELAVPTALTIYGVRVPQLRAVARDWARAHGDVSREDLLALVEALWDGDSREERLLAVYLLGLYKRWIPDLTWDHFDRWRRGVDCWEVGDGLAQWVMAVWMLAQPEARLGHLEELVVDDDLWSRRLALVATAYINRGYTTVTIPDLTLALVERVKTERDPMITKAVSWALRGLVKLHADRATAYLEANRDALAGHVVREVENKLRTGLKSGGAG